VPGFAWHEIDPKRFSLEKGLLKPPWRLVQDKDGRFAWEGGTLLRKKPDAEHSVRLVYPEGYPARFIEARLQPELSPTLNGALGLHVNMDGSICYVTAEGWTPQDTVSDALELLNTWWSKYHWLTGLDLDRHLGPRKQIPER